MITKKCNAAEFKASSSKRNRNQSTKKKLIKAISAFSMAALAGIVPAMAAYRTPVARNLRPLG